MASWLAARWTVYLDLKALWTPTSFVHAFSFSPSPSFDIQTWLFTSRRCLQQIIASQWSPSYWLCVPVQDGNWNYRFWHGFLSLIIQLTLTSQLPSQSTGLITIVSPCKCCRSHHFPPCPSWSKHASLQSSFRDRPVRGMGRTPDAPLNFRLLYVTFAHKQNLHTQSWYQLVSPAG